MITGAQIRAARKLLGWRQAELAKQARIPAHSVESAESSVGESFVPGHRTRPAQFTSGDEPGVKLKAMKARKAK
jgi:transcriptional regulator with XRE-family HTH domain